MPWYGPADAESIRALAAAWHEDCKDKDCDCEVGHRERDVLHRLRPFYRGKHRHVPVREMPGPVDRG
jgi:hypothetical protein